MRLFFLGLTLTAAAQAATTINTNWSVTNAPVSISTNITVSGPTTLTNIGSGTFTAMASLSAIGGTTLNAPFTITLSTGDTITGFLTIPTSVFVGGATSGTGSATITGGTGAYVNASGSFPNLSGSTTGTFPANLTLSFSGAGTVVTGGPGLPNITSIGDAASYGTSLAQGGLIVVIGTNLSASGYFSANFPLPTSFQNVKITFTPIAGGTGADAYMIYTYNQNNINQLAAIVPSALAAGTYNVTVTNNGAVSVAVQATVVKAAPQIFTQDSSGTGLAVVQNYVSAAELDVNRATTGSVNGVGISPAHPSQPLIAWATNLGASPTADNVASQGYDFTKHGHTFQVIVGGTTIPADYAGPAPGLAPTVAQINFTLPATIGTGCAQTFQVVEDNVPSGVLFIDIAAAGSDACVSPFFTKSQLQSFDQGSNSRYGSFTLEQFSETLPSVGTVQGGIVSGSFVEINTFHLGVVPPQVGTTLPTTTQCFVFQITGGQGGQSSSVIYGGINRDSGTVMVSGPTGSNLNNTVIPQSSDYSYFLIATSTAPGSPNLTPGSYKASSSGGKNVGAWSVTTTLSAPPSSNNLPSSIPRNADFTLPFAPSTGLVEVSISSVLSSGTSQTGASVICIGPASAGSITVPGSDLAQLPANPNGSLIFLVGGAPTSFTAPASDGGNPFPSTITSFAGTETTVALQ